jgi:hypothetical protein
MPLAQPALGAHRAFAAANVARERLRAARRRIGLTAARHRRHVAAGIAALSQSPTRPREARVGFAQCALRQKD